MKITQINDIQSIGSFESSYGTMNKFQYALADGTIGEANHKTATSPFKVGQEIAYEVQGKSPKGTPKLKLSKPEKANFGGSQTSGDAQTHVVASNAPKSHANGAGGACGPTIGMAIKAGVDICLALKEQPTGANIHRHAHEVMLAVKRLEDGLNPVLNREEAPF